MSGPATTPKDLFSLRPFQQAQEFLLAFYRNQKGLQDMMDPNRVAALLGLPDDREGMLLNTYLMSELMAKGWLKEFGKNGFYQLTLDGWEAAERLSEEGINSTNCFVAMSFASDVEHLFDEAFKPACMDLGFLADRVDRSILKSEETINEGILAGIKRCRFCIADFTYGSSGVYFEAGYALGRGKTVIYSCRKDHFDRNQETGIVGVHFDLNHYPILIYETAEQLRQMISNAITVRVLA